MAQGANFPWIAIDGCVGAGKTTLALVMAETLKINLELEKSNKHPFLEDFYTASSEVALETELGFVIIHYHQISQVIMKRQTPVVTDFTLAKDVLFARMNLVGDQMSLFQSVYDYFSTIAATPTLLVKLEASDKLLWRRVKLRDRPFERQMKRDYLQRLNREYEGLLDVCRADKVITLRSDDYDIVNDEQDRDRIIREIATAAGIAV